MDEKNEWACKHCAAILPFDKLLNGLCTNCHDVVNSVEAKQTNPKDAIGCNKLPLHLWPETATAMGCVALLEGACKYGRSNFRPMGVRASIYYDACRRHLNAWFEGENLDPDSGVNHLGHALACLAVLVDAEVAGVLNDDRMYPVNYRPFIDDLTKHVGRIKSRYADRNVKHWTIQDKPHEK